MSTLALLALGPLNTTSSGRSLFLNCFVASTICFVVYYVTSISLLDTSSPLQLRGGGGAQVTTSNSLDFDPMASNKSSLDAGGTKVVWIMSFGGSGTSYTIMNVEHMTNTTTATNYASDIDPNVPVPSARQGRGARTGSCSDCGGPFLHHPGDRVPQYILTKTHCGGYCMDCGVSSYFDMSLSRFEEQCRTGTSRGGQVVKYDSVDVEITKAIHLIRDPFDNIVGRFHLGSAHRQARGEAGFNHSQEGLEEWCEYLDNKYHEQDLSTKVLPMDLPCRAEWYRYVQWHNHAVNVTEKLSEVYHLYYDNYTSNYVATVNQLLDFLNLRAVNDPLDFLANKTYLDYFTVNHRRQAARFVQSMATDETWQLINHFFEPYLIEDPVDGDNQLVLDITSNGTNNLPDGFNYSLRAEVVWLMSFPNSGTSYTITNTEHMSRRSTASNYAEDFELCLPVRPEFKDGPFLHDLKLPLAKYTLTKTHCGGYCTDCSPHSYVETLDSFQKSCLSGHRNQDGRVIDTTYHSNVPVKAVHLIRSPYDNIVARMHLAVKKRRQELGWDNEKLDTFDNSAAGIDAWCEYIDGLYPKQEESSSFIPADIKHAWKGVPCHAEWFRWVQWHNRAVQLTSRLQQQRSQGFPVHLLYYEDYGTNYSTTVASLFDFLELEVERDPIEFIPGKTYLGYFSVEAQRSAARFVKLMATPECWELVKHYFKGVLD